MGSTCEQKGVLKAIINPGCGCEWSGLNRINDGPRTDALFLDPGLVFFGFAHKDSCLN